MKLVKAASMHPVSVLMFYAAVVTLGSVAFFQLPQGLLPGVRMPEARIITEYPGLPAVQIESLITEPLEDVLSTVASQRSISSVSMDGVSSVLLEFGWNVDLHLAAVDVREKIDAVYPFLPHGASKPIVVGSQGGSDRPVLTVALVPADGRGIQDISSVVRGEFASKVQQTPGVASVRTVGLAETEIRVEVDDRKLAAAGLALRSVCASLSASIQDVPLGTIVEGPKEHLVQGTTGVDTVREIRQIPLMTRGGGVLPLESFANVYVAGKQPTSYFHHNAEEAIGIFIEKTPESGTLNTARNLRRILESQRRAFARQFEIRIIDDPAAEIEQAVRFLLLSLCLGFLAVVGLLVFLYRRAALALIVAASIPVSVMAVFLFMYFARVDVNLISLSGIAIGIGMIVDNSIVVLDSLLRSRARGSESVESATAETSRTIVGSTATSMLVFLPVVFLPGNTGALFRDLAMIVSFLLSVSLLCAFTLTPALYAALAAKGFAAEANTVRLSVLESRYRRFLMNEPLQLRVAVPLVCALFAAGLLSLFMIPKRVLPDTDPQKLEVILRFSGDTPLASSRSLSQHIASNLLQIPGVESVFASAGYDSESLADRADPQLHPSYAYLQVTLDREATRRAEIVKAEIGSRLDTFPEVDYFTQRPTDSMRRLLGASDTLVFRLAGSDRDLLLEKGRTLIRQLEERVLIRGGWIDTRQSRKRFDLDLDLAALAAQQIRTEDIIDTLHTALRGRIAAEVPMGDRRVAVRVRLDPHQVSSPEKLEKVHIPAQQAIVETGAVGRFQGRSTCDNLFRFDRRAAVSLILYPREGAVNRLRRVLTEEHASTGELLAVSALKSQQRHILTVFTFALLLMYLLIGAQFESFLLPLILIASLLPALCGSLILLSLCRYSLNINSFLGILILSGTAVNISIVLAAALQRSGQPGGEDWVEAGASRLRPVAATVLSTSVAVLPIALNNHGEAALHSNTAVALLGGLLIGSISLLLVFPLVYRRCCHRSAAVLE